MNIRDNSLLSMERQVAPVWDQIRTDHRARYELVLDNLAGDSLRVADFGCGVGYGACHLLSDVRVADVDAFDISAETLDYADSFYSGPNYSWTDLEDESSRYEGYDLGILLEVIEHVKDPRSLLKRIGAKQIWVSTPNAAVFPKTPEMKFHYRHYTESEMRRILYDSGFCVEEVFHQYADGSFGHHGGKYLIFKAGAKPVQKPRVRFSEPEPASLEGKHVSILALGPSLAGYTEIVKRMGGRQAFCDEVWGINAVGGIFQCDRIFHMDDVRVQERRAAAAPQSNIANMLSWLKLHEGPIYTSHVEPGYPGLVPFPLEEAIKDLGMPYFNSTAAYAVAFAIMNKVRQISVFGFDFTYQNSHKAERGRACVEFWLAAARARGISIKVGEGSSLLDVCEPFENRVYGYDGYEVSVYGDGRVEFNPKELPSAEEIEARYCHEQPTSPHLRKGGAE